MVTTGEAHPGWGMRADPATPGAAGPVAEAVPEVTTFVGRADNGVEVSVGVRPVPVAGHTVVLLDLCTPAQEMPAGVRLRPEQASRLAAALSAAAFAAGGQTPGGPAAPGHTHPEPDPDAELTEVTAVEGTPAAELSAALAQLPSDAVLADFAADADVSLFFGPPAAADPAART